MNKEENILGTEKIGKLIKKFSVPAIISLLVNSLYNIVDQIFIGRGIGYLGNGATNIVFPIVVMSMALSFMIGDGSASYLSLKLGENKKEDAEKGVANGIIIGLIISILYSFIIVLFLIPILNLLGCTDNLRNYAIEYGRIIAFGLPFAMMGMILNTIIRADGSPRYAMTTMIAGAIVNTILDPIVIFVLKWGVQGAAIATVIGQLVTFLFNIVYLRKFKTISLVKENFKINFNILKKIIGLGISSFITELSFVIIMAIENNLLGKYGAKTKFGSEIPITVLGIVMKISQILTSIIIGISAGSQPIWGYNYGARKFDRVKKTLKIVLGISSIISIIAFVLFQTIPDKLILIFGNGNELYIEFACIAFRTYLMLCIFNGIQIPSGIFFQSIGKSNKSAILSLSRQILFLIPSMIVLGEMFGLKGMLYSGPIADGLAFILSTVFLIYEIKHLNNNSKINNTLPDDTSTQNILKKNVVITISRQYGSGGRYIGRLIADKLGIKFYDKDFIEILSKETGLDVDYIESNEQKRNNLDNINNFAGISNSDELFIRESELIRKVANEESCVIIGRCSDFILKDNDNTIKVFIYSDINSKINRATKFYGINENKAKKEIQRIDKLRANHYKYYTDREWQDVNNYDICINSDKIGIENVADLICKMALEK